MEEGTFEHIHAFRYLTFTIPSPTPNSPLLHVAVLDSPSPTTDPRTSAMLVPPGRESDWTFSTREGHLQLLLGSPGPLSRLALISNVPASTPQHLLEPLLFALCPKSAFSSGSPPRASFLAYEHHERRSSTVETAVGPTVGEMLVEDVEMEGGGETRRRLRFRRMPNLVQSQVLIAKPSHRRVDPGSLLLQPYLTPMVAGLWLIAPTLERRGVEGRVLCLGVGGGGLPMFLQGQLGLNVLAIEIDRVVLDIARRYFGLVEKDDYLRVCIGDAIELMDHFARGDRESGAWKEEMGCWWWESLGEIDAIMVDLDSCDPNSGVVAPPVEFVRRSVVMGARAALHEGGILVINVVQLYESRYLQFIELLGEVFSEVYEVDVGKEENRVVVATASPVDGMTAARRGGDCPLRKKLAEIVGSRFINSIKKKA